MKTGLLPPAEARLIPLLGMDAAQLAGLDETSGLPFYRCQQIARWIYLRGARSFEEMTDLPKRFREQLQAKYEVGRPRTVAARHSSDGTVKLLLEMSDGERVEAVGLPYEDRFSCCLSTQVGCPVGCVFCATGASRFRRSLTAGEMVAQVLEVQDWARNHASEMPAGADRVDRIDFMGMGEPLLNYAETLKAAHLLHQEMGIGMRHLTLSTAGHVPGIRRLAKEKLQLTLAVSLHASNDALRQQLVPGMARWGLADLLAACREYVAATGRRVTFEYCLLQGVNDGVQQAEELARLLRGMNCHVNLIPYNAVRGLGFSAPSHGQVHRFRQRLESRGIQVTQRAQRGADIEGACGQLRRGAGQTQVSNS